MGIQHRLKISAANRKRRGLRAFLVLRNGQQRRLLAQALDIGACRAFQLRGELVEIDVGSQRHATRAEMKDRRPIRSAGFRERKDIVKPAAAQERRLDALGAIGGREKQYAFNISQVVNFPQELAEDALVDV